MEGHKNFLYNICFAAFAHSRRLHDKTLCKDSFLYFPLFGSIKKEESKENYILST